MLCCSLLERQSLKFESSRVDGLLEHVFSRNNGISVAHRSSCLVFSTKSSNLQRHRKSPIEKKKRKSRRNQPGGNSDVTISSFCKHGRGCRGKCAPNECTVGEPQQRNRRNDEGQVQTLKLRSSVTEMNGHWMCFDRSCRWQRRESPT